MPRLVSRKSWTFMLGTFLAIWLVQDALTVLAPAIAFAAPQPDENPAPVADAQAPAAAPPAAPEESKPKQQSLLAFFFNALGIRYTVAFLVISFTFVAFLVMNILGLRRDMVCPRHLAEAFEANLNEKRFQEAFDLAKNDESMMGQMLAAGMQNLQQGYDKAIEAMGQVGEDENMKLEHRLSFLSLVGSIAPMVGLLGTVDGMVQSFIDRKSTRLNSSHLGISYAVF